MNILYYPRLRCFLVRQTLVSASIANAKTLARPASTSPGQSWLYVPGNPLVKWPSTLPLNPSPPAPAPPSSPKQNAGPNPASSLDAFKTISDLLADPALTGGPPLESALDRTGIEPDSDLLLSIFRHFDSSPKLLHSLFLWAEKRPGFSCSSALFDAVINVLAKSRDFESAWSMILDRLAGTERCEEMVSMSTFAIMIRRYARVGLTQPAIRTCEYSHTVDLGRHSDVETSLLEILLDSLCKEGHVRAASKYFYYRRDSDTTWNPSIRAYNILLNGWFQSKKVKHAEKLWVEMKRENVKPTVVTYGTLVEGYCRMRRADRATDLIHKMRREGIELNAIVYNPVIDALGEAGRFKELSGMMERFLICESGPTLSTYNSLVKGFCKAGELVEASKTLRTMISRGFTPTLTTYNYFFRYFSKSGKIEEGMNLYTKMIESGYNPDRLTYHLLLKMLCEAERLELALQLSKEMRSRGFDMDLATSTMLVHLLCKMYRFDEAFAEFEDMIRRGIVPQCLSFQRMNDELNRNGRTEMARKLHEMMSSLPHSAKLPDSYRGDGNAARHFLDQVPVMPQLVSLCSSCVRKFVQNPDLVHHLDVGRGRGIASMLLVISS
ncbi:hypothetical protein CRG98_032480 [Punica granatum]|uniref:Pentatricopeptide repeat-containing protein At5g11310, mitochondrial n=1 Tax=Punica granatum TaxID=22663 RepID=A0A2I0IT04_PUNGR|nr:hypothetical protein CRG98_032480 [Punica granatum]